MLRDKVEELLVKGEEGGAQGRRRSELVYVIFEPTDVWARLHFEGLWDIKGANHCVKNLRAEVHRALDRTGTSRTLPSTRSTGRPTS